jgi:ribosome-associated protein
MPLRPAPGIEIPDEELIFRASRSGGPGGQHVNTTSSRVTLRLDLLRSPSIPDDVRDRLVGRLGRRVAADGTIGVTAQDSRSQHANRKLAADRLEALLARALAVEAPRLETSVPRAEKRRRLDTKRRRGEVKRGRGRFGGAAGD